MRLTHSLPLLLLIALACRAVPVRAQDGTIVETTLPGGDVSATLKVLAAQAPALAPGAQRTILPLRLFHGRSQDLAGSAMRGAAPYSALQGAAAAPAMAQVNTGGALLSIDGIASNRTIAPPDPNGAVGASQYVQWVNSRLAIYDKATGALQLGPIAGNTVFGGFAGSPGADACRLSNFGDPIVQYDKAARRWLLTHTRGGGNPC